MRIKLLKEGYKNDEKFYKAFINDELWDSEYISNDVMETNQDFGHFHIYFKSNKSNTVEVKTEFARTIIAIEQKVIDSDRNVYMSEIFWHSLLCLYWRDYLISEYPGILDSYSNFKKIIIRDFDWENYIYKSILIAQYVDENRPNDKQNYYKLILDNIDMFNYIIKYEIFRNGYFLINIMDIINDNNLSKLCKAKIKDHPELGADERYGRRVILEMNKSYPVVLCPMLNKDELEIYFFKYLSYYIDINDPYVKSQYDLN